jgi:DNA-binding CsgD family transcriptional regulator/tetratricopeptide (TPR) repeat protein
VADLPGGRAFVGRAAELAHLRAALDEVAARHAGRCIVVGGEAGIGKSRLIQRFTADLPGATVLEGACLEVGVDAFPYAPFVEILRTLVRQTPERLLPAVLGPGRAELTRLLPELAARAADMPPDLELDRASQARMFELVLGVFERLARERPLVVVVEDLHWADRSTLELLGFLARALRDDPVLLLLTTRSEATGSGANALAFIAELEREEHVDRIELRPFDRDEVAAQAASLLDEPPPAGDVDRLLSRTDGNPFYVEELILAGSGPGPGLPPVLRDVLAARVAGISPAARDVLRAAAAAGRRIDDELLAAALDMPVRQLAPALREALESGILVRRDSPDGPGLAFRHALLHEVVDAELMPAERTALHAAFALALEARRDNGDRTVPAVEIAGHWDGAHDLARALPHTVRAAAAAEQVYAFPEALALWERAADMFEALGEGGEIEGRDLADVLLRAAECAVLISHAPRAVEFAQRALVALVPLADATRTEFIENRLRWYLWWAGRRDEAAAAVRLALATMPAEPPTIARARALSHEAGILMLTGDLAASAERAREAIAIGERLDAPGEVALALGVLGWDLALLGDVDAGIAEFRRGEAIGEALGSVEGIALAATNLAALLDRVGRSEASLEAARAGYALTERFGVGRTYGAVLLGHAAKAELALGRWDDAERSTSLGLRRGAIDDGALWLQVNRARLLIGRGHFAEAGVLLRRARAIDERLGGSEYHTALLVAEAELAVWSGHPTDAIPLGEAGLASLAGGLPPDPSLAWLAALVLRAVADAAEGAPSARAATPALDRTHALVARIKTVIGEVRQRPGFSTGERAIALLALLDAEGERVAGRPSPEAWAVVEQHWEALQRPFQVAYARFRRAEALLASRGDREVVARELNAAAATADRLGAEPLRGLVLRLAAQARISLPDAPAIPVAGAAAHDLTAREVEVLRLVAAGWTNQQIADALFITRKTASVHVSNIMAKLGCANRGEAAALAHRLGLVVDAPLPVGHT